MVFTPTKIIFDALKCTFSINSYEKYYKTKHLKKSEKQGWPQTANFN